MKALKIVVIIIVVLGLLLAGGLFYVNHYVQTPAFKQQVLDAARKATGTDVKINEMTVSLFSGIALEGVTVANPQGYTGDLLTAKAFTLRYRLLPLLHKRVEVESLTLETPVITLAQNAKGEWNYDQLGAKTTSPTKPAATSTAPPAPSSTGTGGLEISLSRVEMKHASVVMLGENNKELLRINDANFSSSVDLVGDKLNGRGTVTIDLVTAANALFIHKISTPVSVTSEAVKLAPLSGKLADGEIGGDAALALAGAAKYTVNLQVKNADVVKLLQEAGVSKQVMSGGKLQINAALTGSGGLPTMAGRGQADIVGGQLVDIPVLSLLATVLQLPVLRNLKFDECRLEFSLSNNVMQTPVISLKSPQVQITGSGSVALEDYALNHTFTLALAQGALDNAPKEVRGIFTPRQDGFLTIDFKVWGPYDSPKTDIKERLVKGAADQLIQKGLQQLFKQQMRIIAGIAKGMVLTVPRGTDVRPTTDRTREAIFSSLGARVPGATVLDLFAGTGALGIEAASRGAQRVVLVEKLRAALEAIEKNVAAFSRQAGATAEIEVRRMDAFRGVRVLAGESRQFSLIFADPPYGSDAQALLNEPELPQLVTPDGMLVLESAVRNVLAVPSTWRCRREVTYGETHVTFLVPFGNG